MKHILKKEIRLFQHQQKAEINEEETILLNCGSYFADIINIKAPVISEVYVIHLYPNILKQIYDDEIPDFFTNKPS